MRAGKKEPSLRDKEYAKPCGDSPIAWNSLSSSVRLWMEEKADSIGFSRLQHSLSVAATIMVLLRNHQQLLRWDGAWKSGSFCHLLAALFCDNAFFCWDCGEKQKGQVTEKVNMWGKRCKMCIGVLPVWQENKQIHTFRWPKFLLLDLWSCRACRKRSAVKQVISSHWYTVKILKHFP